MEDQHREAAQARGAALAPDMQTATLGTPSRGGQFRVPLSCTRIIDAAVRYVDDNCLDELSMRRLGSELGVEAMSLYRYFPSKAALLDAVVDRLLSDLVLPHRRLRQRLGGTGPRLRHAPSGPSPRHTRT